jgi:predicted nucleotidyltransferase
MEEIKSAILQKLKSDELIQYLNKLNLNNMLVFGSLITEDFNENSDVDIAILGKEKFSMDIVLNLELFLENLLNRSIDVVDLNSENLDIFIKISILNDGKSIYTSDNNKSLEELIDKIDIYFKENESFFYKRKVDLLS